MSNITAIGRVTAFALAMTAAPAWAGWAATEWGMTPEEVQAAMPGTQPLSRGETMNGAVARSKGAHQFASRSVDAVYFYDDTGLAFVQLTVPRRNCEEAVQSIVDGHGAPLRVSDQIIFRLLIWHDEPKATRIRVLVSRSICNVYFERLAEYRERDLADH